MFAPPSSSPRRRVVFAGFTVRDPLGGGSKSRPATAFAPFTVVTLKSDADRAAHEQILYPRHAVQVTAIPLLYAPLTLTLTLSLTLTLTHTLTLTLTRT